MLDGFSGRAAWPERGVPTVVFNQVAGATIRHARALEGTKVFLKVTGTNSQDIVLTENDFRKAKVPYQRDKSVPSKRIKAMSNVH